MIGLSDLNKAINGVIKQNFPKHRVYAGEVVEGFKRPSFFTQVMPMRGDYETINYKSDRIMIVITYFNKDDTELENIKTHDELANAFGMTLKVNNRHFLLKNISSKDVDGALQFSFSLNYWSQIERKEKHELMKELEFENR